MIDIIELISAVGMFIFFATVYFLSEMTFLGRVIWKGRYYDKACEWLEQRRRSY